MLVIVGASGKLGFATLTSLLSQNLIPLSNIIVTTSSPSGASKLEPFRLQGVQIRRANWDDDEAVWQSVLQGCSKLFLISSARVHKDFHDAPLGEGRESDHFKVLNAAKKVGVGHIYYTSLAFQNPSKSRVMKAHERTEEWLRGAGMGFTILREGLYNESWPLYFGHFDVGNGDERSEVVVAGDGKISWTSIEDLGLANALILAEPFEEWAGKVVYLAQEKAWSLEEVADGVSRARGREVKIKIVSRPEHETYYVQQRGMDEAMVKWWSKTYDALNDGECEIHDPTLERLLASRGITPTSLKTTIDTMLTKST
jgi:uncharacterized protein YbjT (DUF2867 family)